RAAPRLLHAHLSRPGPRARRKHAAAPHPPRLRRPGTSSGRRRRGMKVYRSLAEIPPDFGPSAVTIGNFDGVHRGHRQILRRVRAIAAEHGWKPSVLTFDPHPT